MRVLWSIALPIVIRDYTAAFLTSVSPTYDNFSNIGSKIDVLLTNSLQNIIKVKNNYINIAIY